MIEVEDVPVLHQLEAHCEGAEEIVAAEKKGIVLGEHRSECEAWPPRLNGSVGSWLEKGYPSHDRDMRAPDSELRANSDPATRILIKLVASDAEVTRNLKGEARRAGTAVNNCQELNQRPNAVARSLSGEAHPQQGTLCAGECGREARGLEEVGVPLGHDVDSILSLDIRVIPQLGESIRDCDHLAVADSNPSTGVLLEQVRTRPRPLVSFDYRHFAPVGPVHVLKMILRTSELICQSAAGSRTCSPIVAMSLRDVALVREVWKPDRALSNRKALFPGPFSSG